jgi:predicted permease
MLLEILNIVAPVFLVITAGYISVRSGIARAESIDQLMQFAIQFAIPCLLFLATSSIDLDVAFGWRMMLAYYMAAITCFTAAFFVVKNFFKRRPGEAVGVAFAAMFSNLVMLGLPISERAWGLDSLAPNYALVAVNAPICYLLGIIAMEFLRADGRGVAATSGIVVKAMFRNSLMIGIGLGFIVNLGGIGLPGALLGAIDLLAQAALPIALFALGGVLTRYKLSKSLGEAGLIVVLSLVVQPAITLLLSWQLELPAATTKSIVLMSAVAPGLNAYLFASMYNRGTEAAASAVLLSTMLAGFTVSAWLLLL